ncbi:MAG: hypothetical protein KBD64_01320 [Gammaproteobacteria bacterium]|nr:hypothetical protein [Gammaproteobacteria bacterium]
MILYSKLIRLILLSFVFFTASVLAQHYADYDGQQSQLVLNSNLLKTNDITLPVEGSGNVTLTVFYDYNCPSSRDLLKLLYNQDYAKTKNVKIVYRPMDYGFNSKDVLQAVLNAKNMSGNLFKQLNLEIIKIDSPIMLAHLQGIAQRQGLDFNKLINPSSADLKKIQQEMDKNKQDFEALPLPSMFGQEYKNAVPVIILSNANNDKKYIYFIGSDQYSLDTAIAAIGKA